MKIRNLDDLKEMNLSIGERIEIVHKNKGLEMVYYKGNGATSGNGNGTTGTPIPMLFFSRRPSASNLQVPFSGRIEPENKYPLYCIDEIYRISRAGS